MTLLLRPGDAAALPPAAAPVAAAARERTVSRVNPVVRAAFYLFVASIPFELPKSPLPLEVPTLTGVLLLLTTVLDLRASYRRVPAALVCFMAWFAILAVQAVFTTTHPTDALKFLVLTFQLLLLFWVSANLLGDERTLRGMLWTLVGATTLRALVQVSGLAATSRAVWTGGERVSAFGQNPNLSAIIMASGLAAVVALFVLRRPKLPHPGLLAVPAALLLAAAIIQTGSRGGLACAGAGLMVLLFSGRTFAARVRNGLLGVLAVAALGFAALQSETMHNRVISNQQVHYFAGRELIYPAVMDMIREKPLTGWGPVENQYEIANRIGEKRKLKRDAHNIVLEVLSSTGMIGALPFFMGLLLCLDGAWRARHGALGLLPLGLAMTVLVGTISGTWIASKILWLVLGLALSAGLYWKPTPLEERWSRCAA